MSALCQVREAIKSVGAQVQGQSTAVKKDKFVLRQPIPTAAFSTISI